MISLSPAIVVVFVVVLLFCSPVFGCERLWIGPLRKVALYSSFVASFQKTRRILLAKIRRGVGGSKVESCENTLKDEEISIRMTIILQQ